MGVIYKKYFLPMILLKKNTAGAEGQPAFLVIFLREAVLRSGNSLYSSFHCKISYFGSVSFKEIVFF